MTGYNYLTFFFASVGISSGFNEASNQNIADLGPLLAFWAVLPSQSIAAELQ